MIELLVLRHAEAEFRAASDAQRKLTPLGRSQLQQVLDQSREALQQVRQVWVSPYVRAQQTCELALACLPSGVPVITREGLTPDGHPAQVLEWLQAAQEQPILLVSHQPLVGELVCQLCGFEPGEIAMGTSALAALSMPLVAPGLAQLRWLRQP
jgi:phosphohistidine phosphatase